MNDLVALGTVFTMGGFLITTVVQMVKDAFEKDWKAVITLAFGVALGTGLAIAWNVDVGLLVGQPITFIGQVLTGFAFMGGARLGNAILDIAQGKKEPKEEDTEDFDLGDFDEINFTK